MIKKVFILLVLVVSVVVQVGCLTSKPVLTETQKMKLELDEKGAITLGGIYFDTDKATLKPQSITTLNKVVMLMNDYPDLKVEIAGHTDKIGSKDHNKKLSEERAKSVKKFLEDNQIDPGRLRAAGYGYDKPVADNNSEEGRAQNRRVELIKIN